MIILTKTLFDLSKCENEFIYNLCNAFDFDHDYSGENGEEFISQEAKDAKYESDFAYTYDKQFLEKSFEDMNYEDKIKVIYAMVDDFLLKNINYYHSEDVSITKIDNDKVFLVFAVISSY